MTREEQIYEVFKILLQQNKGVDGKTLAQEAVIMIDTLYEAERIRTQAAEREKTAPVWEILNLTVRTANCLKGEDIRTLEELCSKKEIDLLKIPNLGRRSLNEIREALAQRGMMLR